MAKGVARRIRYVLAGIEKYLEEETQWPVGDPSKDCLIAYRQALQDVLFALNGHDPLRWDLWCAKGKEKNDEQ
jgi:hypothetical protein